MPNFMPPKLPAWADPDTQSVTDPLWSILLKKALGALGANDPNQIMGVGMPMSIVGEGKLEPFIVNMYKQRLRADPSLAYHPGLQQVPEFKAAFSELFPNKRIVGPGQALKPTTSSVLGKMPTPPTATAPEEVLDAAKGAVGPVKPNPKQLTFGDLNAVEGRPIGSQGNISRTKYPNPREIADGLKGWTGSKKEYAQSLGIPEGTLGDILTRIALENERLK